MQKKLVALAGLSLVNVSVLAATSANTTKTIQPPQNPIEKSAPVQVVSANPAKAIKGQYIVTFKEGTPDAIVDMIRLQVNKQYGVEQNVLNRFSLTKGFAGSISPALLKKINL